MFESITSLFQRLRETAPQRRIFTYVDDNGDDQESLTVEELGEAADRVVVALRSWGYAPGDRAILVYPPSLDFVKAFLGCLAAGVIPVPVYPPNPFKLRKDLAAFTTIAANAGARGALTNSMYDRTRSLADVGNFFRKDAPRWPDLRWHRTDRLRPSAQPATWHQVTCPDQPAFLQYTSGSTAAPKGVIISHGNLVHEVAGNAVDLGLGPHTRSVVWVPQYHDLGLISVILSTIAGNSLTTLLAPLTFLQAPRVWFDVMSRVRATHTAAPNFAFELAVRKTTPEQRAGWDLSRLRVVLSAAEPIRQSTMDTFFTAFAGTGLTREAFFPAYGLAEHTVSVSMGGKTVLRLDKAALETGRVRQSPDGRGAVSVVGCGRITKPDTTVRIVDPATCRPCGPDEVGEVWVDSPTKGTGYWGMPEQSRETFHARIAGGGDECGYLRTGDLGFFHNGELFITGRCKDLIIMRGRNLYPVDIEDSVRDCHPLIRPGGVAAFAAEVDGTEQLVLFVEARRDKLSPVEIDEIIASARRRVYTEYQIRPYAIVLGYVGTVRKTTSGKIRRLACRQAFLNGEVAAAATTIHVAVRKTTNDLATMEAS